jgi:hypothetical protein
MLNYLNVSCFQCRFIQFSKNKGLLYEINRKNKGFESIVFYKEDEPSKLNAKRQLTNPRFVFRDYP